MSIQIVVPVYNEGDGILKLYHELSAVGFHFDILKIVYDFDGDTTIPFIKMLSEKDPRVVGEKNQYGKGVINALKWGFSNATDGPVLVVMGDSSDSLEIIPAMLKLHEEGSTLVSPSRYMPGGVQEGGELLKKTLSMLAGRSLNILGLPTSDPTNNFKLYDGAWLRSQNIESIGGFEVALELCYKAFSQGKKISQLPTTWRDRTQGQSNFKLFKWLPMYLKWYFLTIGSIFRKKFYR